MQLLYPQCNPVKIVYLPWQSDWIVSSLKDLTTLTTTHMSHFLPTIFLIAYYFRYLQLVYQAHVKAC